MQAALAALPELNSVDSDMQVGGQEVVIQIDRELATRLGVDVSMLDTMLNNAFSQRQIATLYRTMNQYHVVMMLDDSYTRDPAILQALYVINNNGERVPLSAFAHFSGGNTPLSVAHQGQSATTTVAFNLNDGVSLQQAQALIKMKMAEIGLPVSIQAGFQGTAKVYQKMAATMPWLLVAALAAIYIVLGILYESYIHPLTILSTLPSAGVGPCYCCY